MTFYPPAIMHEWALAEAIISAALQNAEKEHLQKITEIHISLGELQQIEQDIFEFALNEIKKTQPPIIKNAKIILTIQPSTLQCKNCNYQWQFQKQKKQLTEDESEAIHFIPEVAFVHMRCPHCKSPDFTIIKGRGVTITNLRGKRP